MSRPKGLSDVDNAIGTLTASQDNLCSLEGLTPVIMYDMDTNQGLMISNMQTINVPHVLGGT